MANFDFSEIICENIKVLDDIVKSNIAVDIKNKNLNNYTFYSMSGKAHDLFLELSKKYPDTELRVKHSYEGSMFVSAKLAPY